MRHGSLFYRQIGLGQPVIVVHGGPRFDHTYLLPDMDHLSDSYRLIYYDQRGRGRSVADVEGITIKSEIEDLEAVRAYFRLDAVALLGHSWGGHLAMEYAIRYPDRVSHLILMNSAPASREDYRRFEEELARRTAVHKEKLNMLMAAAAGQEGALEARRDYYRLYFSTTIRRPEHLDSLNLTFSHFTREVVQRAGEIGSRLTQETWSSSDFNLFPQLAQLRVPTLVIHGDYDFVPVECAAHIAETIPGAQFVLLRECGHFSYIEAPEEVRRVIDAFLSR